VRDSAAHYDAPETDCAVPASTVVVGSATSGLAGSQQPVGSLGCCVFDLVKAVNTLCMVLLLLHIGLEVTAVSCGRRCLENNHKGICWSHYHDPKASAVPLHIDFAASCWFADLWCAGLEATAVSCGRP
jgi:hypothetical protein